MKIVMIASLYRPHTLGGAEVVFQMIVDELKKTHEVIVISARQWQGFRSFVPQMSDEEEVRVYRFFPLNICSFITFLRLPFFVRILWHILDACNIHSYWVTRSILKKERPDVVITHNLKGIGLTIPRAIASLRIPHVHTVHDIQLIYPSGVLLYGEEKSVSNRVMSFVSGVMTRWLFRSPSVIIFASYFLKNFYARRSFFWHADKIVIPNPISRIISGKEECPLSNDGKIVTFAFVGQLETHKGIEFLLRAWAAWKRDDVRLHIAGRGCTETAVRNAVRGDSRIKFFGYCDDVPSFLGHVSFVIVPSLCYENAPMVILESAALCIPAVVSRIGGMAEYIHDGVNGFLFVPGDVQSLIDAMERVLAAPEQYSDLSRNARESVRPYTIARYCAALLHIVRT